MWQITQLQQFNLIKIKIKTTQFTIDDTICPSRHRLSQSNQSFASYYATAAIVISYTTINRNNSINLNHFLIALTVTYNNYLNLGWCLQLVKNIAPLSAAPAQNLIPHALLVLIVCVDFKCSNKFFLWSLV